MSNIKAVDLNKLVQGGQAYLAFPFSKGSLRLFQEIKKLNRTFIYVAFTEPFGFLRKNKKFRFLVQLLGLPLCAIYLHP